MVDDGSIDPEADVIRPIFQRIEDFTGVKSYLGEAELAKNRRPPGYVWVPRFVDSNSAENVGDEPREIEQAGIRLEIHCWGATFAQAFLMRRALLTAIERQVSYHFRVTGGPVSNTHEDLKGWVIVLNVTIDIPIHEVSVDRVEWTKARILEVGFDTSNVVEGDGVLNAPAA